MVKGSLNKQNVLKHYRKTSGAPKCDKRKPGCFKNLDVCHKIQGGSLVITSDVIINGLTIGKGSGDIENNTASGYQALAKNTTGNNNTVSGYQALS